MFRTTAIALIASLAACASAAQEPPATATMPSGAPPVEAPLIDNAGKQIGSVQLTPAPTGVLLRLMVDAGGLSPGWHGTHLHMVGDCSDIAKFQHAGGHIEINNTYHGLLYPHGPEDGDLPNLYVAGDGSAAAEMFTGLITLSEMQDEDGSAIMIHAKPDDHLTQPTGNSGDRVACAALRK